MTNTLLSPTDGITANSTDETLNGLSLAADAASDVVLTVKGFTGQTGDLIRVRDSADNNLVKVDASGFVTVASGSSTSHYPLTVTDASGNNLFRVKKGAVAGAAYPSVYVPGGDILNVRNIQGGFTGTGFNMDLGAGSGTSGERGNLSLNYDVGRGVEVWDGSGTAFTSDSSPGGLVAKFNRTTDNISGDGLIKFYKQSEVRLTGATAFQVGTGAADKFNVNTTANLVECVATSFRVYSDAYSTVKFQVQASTGNTTIAGALDHDGSTVGFYATAPATKQTVSGAKGSNAALGSLLTALAAIGLITDSTTA